MKNPEKNYNFYRPIFYLYLSVVMALSAWPIPRSIPTGNDKINHLAAFIIFSFLISRAFTGIRPGWILTWGIAYGGLIEVVQLFIPGRSSELMDLVADVIGLLVGIIAVEFIRSRAVDKDRK